MSELHMLFTIISKSSQQNQIMCTYLSCSPMHTLDHKLEPIFQHIRTRKINNIHQLHLKDKEIQTSHIREMARETNSVPLPIFYSKSDRIRKLQSFKIRQPISRLQSFQRKQRDTLQPINRQEKVIFVSPSSKVKKHLVQSIDYEGVEKALFRKVKRKTLYQEFYQTILKKDKWMKKTNLGFINSPNIQQNENSQERNHSKEQREPSQQISLQKNSIHIFRTIPKKISKKAIKSQMYKGLIQENSI